MLTCLPLNVSGKIRCIYATICIISMLFTACGIDPNDELDKKISVAIRNDNKVDETEWNAMVSYVLINKGVFPELVDGESSVNFQKLTDRIVGIAHKRRGQTEPDIFKPVASAEITDKPEVKIFIENSGSMDGYVRGIRDFEIVVGRLLVLAKDYTSYQGKNNFDVYFVNKNVFPAPEIKELTDFANALEPKNSIYSRGERGESVLNDILEIILDSTDTNTISILVSDCIYSLGVTKDTKGSLGYQQNGTMDVFLEKFRNHPKRNIATAIYKMVSTYEGNYFPYDYNSAAKNSISLYNSSATRPYYIWMIGEEEVLTSFMKKINPAALKGFRNSYILYNFSRQKTPDYTILKETNVVGSFKQAEEERGNALVHSIEDVEYDNGICQFSLAVDLSNIPVDSSYLLDRDNFRADGYKVVSVERKNRDKLKPNEWKRLEKTSCTHIVTVSTDTKSSLRDLQLELLNNTPAWVTESSSMDDRNVIAEPDKTFGLSYLIKGVAEAYATHNPHHGSYFKIDVSVKK